MTRDRRLFSTPALALALAAPLAAALWLTGCGVQTTVQEVRQAQTDIGDNAIVILSRKHKTQGETEDDFVACVSDGVTRRRRRAARARRTGLRGRHLPVVRAAHRPAHDGRSRRTSSASR